MIVAGIDVGGKNIHVVIKKDGQILGKTTGPSGIKKAEAVEVLYDEALKKAGLGNQIQEGLTTTFSCFDFLPISYIPTQKHYNF